MNEQREQATTCDAVIIGGGPGGSTAAHYLTRAGLRVCIVERETFPRYCVGESLLPYIIPILREMNVLDAVEHGGFLKKFGAVFGDSGAPSVVRIQFDEGLQPEHNYSYQVERDRFDDILLRHARAGGAAVVHGLAEQLIMDGDRVVGVVARERSGALHELRAQLVVDASGRAAFLPRKLRLLEPDPKLDTASVFTIYDGVPQLEEARIGDPVVLTFPDGWFWFIPFLDGRWSVGVVIDRAVYDEFPDRTPERFFDEMVRRAGGRVQRLLANARRCHDLHVLRKFAHRARELAGPGWVAVGDAALFIDPVFAAGVYVAMAEARLAMEAAIPALKAGEPLDASHFRAYSDEVHGGYEVFGRFIYSWQDPAFRRFFFSPGPRPKVLVQTITTILSGGVFDRELIRRGEELFFKFAERDRLPARNASA